MKLGLNILSRVKDLIGTRFKKAEKFTFVAIGDSTIEGIGATHSEKSFAHLIFEVLRQENKHAKYHNLGKSGAKVIDVLKAQLADALDLKPNLVLISVGANDLRHRTKLSDFERDIGYLVETFKNRTGAKVIINSIPDLSHLKVIPFFVRFYVRSQVKKFNSILQKQAELHNAIYVDLHRGSRLLAKKYPEMISADGLHPSDIGYAVLATAVMSQAKEYLFGVSKNN